MSIDSSQIVGRECRFAIHIPNTKKFNLPDLHFVKEQIHYQDGRVEPAVRFIKDYKRSFYVTRKSNRDHKQKKEWTSLENVIEVITTQSELRDAIAKALDMSWSKDHIKKLSTSPYLYGSDITSTALIKNDYRKKWPDLNTPWTVCTLDVETNVLNDTKEIIMLTLTFKNKDDIRLLSVINENFVSGIANAKDQIRNKTVTYLKEYIDRLNLKMEEILVSSEIDIVKTTFQYLHNWKPDFCAIWNIDFDIQRIIEACERASIDPKYIISDPLVPNDLKFFKYVQGPKKKVTASGKEFPIKPANQWHSVSCPCSFTFIDAMCCFRQIRLAKQEEPSYKLDAILNKMLGIRKLTFEEANAYTGLKWHQFMQTYYKIEYIVYNRFDSISMIELDNKTLDLQVTMPTYAGVTDFSKFSSQPKKIADQMYFFLLEQGKIQGTVGQSIEKEEPDLPIFSEEDVELEMDSETEKKENYKILSLKDWIITLPAHLMYENGLQCFEDNEILKSNARGYVFDIDAVSSYPSDILALNVSKETTKKEIITICGVNEKIFRMENINLLSGHTNAVEYCTTMFNFPKPDELLKLYKNK